MLRPRRALLSVAFPALVLLTSPAADEPAPASRPDARATAASERTPLCHLTGNGSYRLIAVDAAAVPAHLAHGDMEPGTGGLDEECAQPSLAACELEPDPGPCDAVIPRWFYEPAVEGCLMFIWGGCGGNANNFETEAECLATCGPT